MGRSSQRYEDLTPAQRRRLMTTLLVRSVLVGTLLFVGYYILPLNRPVDSGIVVLLVGLLVLAGVLTWQVRAIIGSPFPRLRAFETLAIGIPLLLVVFASVYYLTGKAQIDSFTQPMGKTDAMYFTVTVFSTVGFGDITARTELARSIVSVQMMFDLVVFGLVAKLIFGAVEVGLRRRSAPEPAEQQQPTVAQAESVAPGAVVTKDE